MATPLRKYEPVDTGARKDADLGRSPEKYFWGVFRVGIAIALVGAVFYVPPDIPYRGVIRALTGVAFLGIAATTIFRAIKSRLLSSR